MEISDFAIFKQKINESKNMSAFQHVIQDEAELREILGYAGTRAQNKVLPEIDDICRAFIEKSPFVLLGSTDTNGHMDVSPKGDPAGFVQIMDSKTLLIPDHPGNRRGDTLSNMLQNPSIGLLFLVPGRSDTLRINVRPRLCVMMTCGSALSCRAKCRF